MKIHYLVTGEEFSRISGDSKKPANAREEITQIINANRVNKSTAYIKEAVREALGDLLQPPSRPEPPGEGLLGDIPKEASRVIRDHIEEEPVREEPLEQAKKPRPDVERVKRQIDEEDVEFEDEAPPVARKRTLEAEEPVKPKKTRETPKQGKKRKQGVTVSNSSKKPRQMLYRRVKRLETADDDAPAKKPKRMLYVRKKREDTDQVSSSRKKKKTDLAPSVGGWISIY